jgi:hypothetical protein
VDMPSCIAHDCDAPVATRIPILRRQETVTVRHLGHGRLPCQFSGFCSYS